MISSHPPDSPWFKRLLRGWPKRRATTLAAAHEKVIRHSTVECQDLTAKQFAQLAGIDLRQPDETYSLPTPHLAVHTVRSSRTTASCKKPRIWDQDFWQQQQQEEEQQQQQSSSLEAEDCCDRNRPCSFQKGRFQVVVGDYDQDEDYGSILTLHPPVLEWKRKRSQESSCTTTTIITTTTTTTTD